MSDLATRTKVFNALENERFRQEALKSQGKFAWTCAEVGPTDEAKLAVLAEEFGEAARHVTEALIDKKRRDVKNLYKELIEVAAVCVAWCEALEDEKTLANDADTEPSKSNKPTICKKRDMCCLENGHQGPCE